ncbi:nose resistant to fluoxetine protein 6 [Ixodes scapularis]
MPLPPKPEVIAKNTRIIEPEFFPESHVFRELAEKSHNFYHTFFRFGLCLPSHCSREDVEKLVSPVKELLNMETSVLNCDVHQDSKPLNKDQVISLIIIGFFVVVILLATAVDALGRMNHNWKCQVYLKAPVTQSFAEMSLLRATRKLLTVKTPRDEHGRNLQVVHGVRTFNVFWIVVAHTYGFAEQTTYRSGLHVINQASSIFFQPVMNSFLCVDSFFFLSGFLLTFNQCKSTWQTGPVLDFFVKLFGRYWRLVPVAALCMTVLFLLPEVASGPIWHEKLDMAIANCHRSWWSVLLNVQNFYPYEQSCQPHYWYISADMQIFPVVLATSILLGRRVKLGLIVKVAILVLSVLLVGTLTYVNSYPPAIVLFGRDIIYSKGLLSEVYFRPYVHIGPYIVGSLVAYMYLKRDKIHISPVSELWNRATKLA